jgi:hypothetical protein
MSAKITGGSAGFEQSRKLAEYENRKVTINFVVSGDDSDAQSVVIGAFNLAARTVYEGLGYKVESAPQVKGGATMVVTDTAAADKAKAEFAATEAANKEQKPAAKKPGRPPKGTTVTVDATDVDEVTPGGAAPSSTGGTEPQIHTNPESRVGPEDVDDADFTSAEPVAVTNDDLNKAAQNKNKELTAGYGSDAPKKIRQLISKFVQHPKGLLDIPADVRPKFLEELKALD